ACCDRRLVAIRVVRLVGRRDGPIDPQCGVAGDPRPEHTILDRVTDRDRRRPTAVVLHHRVRPTGKQRRDGGECRSRQQHPRGGHVVHVPSPSRPFDHVASLGGGLSVVVIVYDRAFVTLATHLLGAGPCPCSC